MNDYSTIYIFGEDLRATAVDTVHERVGKQVWYQNSKAPYSLSPAMTSEYSLMDYEAGDFNVNGYPYSDGDYNVSDVLPYKRIEFSMNHNVNCITTHASEVLLDDLQNIEKLMLIKNHLTSVSVTIKDCPNAITLSFIPNDGSKVVQTHTFDQEGNITITFKF